MRRRHAKSPLSLFAFQDIVTGMCGIIIFFVLVMLVDLVVKRDPATKAERPPVTEVEDNTKKLRAEVERLRAELKQLRDAARKVIVAGKDQAAPEVAEKLNAKLSEKEREVAALLSQLADLRTRVAAMKNADVENRKRIKEMEETRRLLEGKLAALKGKRGITLIPERGEFKAPVYLVVGRGGVELLRPLQQTVQRKWFFDSELKDKLHEELAGLDHTTHTVVLLVRPSGAKQMWELVRMVKGLGMSHGRDPLEEDVEVTLGKAEGASM